MSDPTYQTLLDAPNARLTGTDGRLAGRLFQCAVTVALGDTLPRIVHPAQSSAFTARVLTPLPLGIALDGRRRRRSAQ